MKNRKKILATIAVFCIYLMLTLPVSFAQTVQHFVDVNIKSPDGSKTLATAKLPSFVEKINKNISLSFGNDVLAKIEYTGRGLIIKKGYIWFCKGESLKSCLINSQISTQTLISPPISFEKYFQDSRNWNDVSPQGGSARYPQTGNIFALINLNVGGQDIWLGSFDTITRTDPKTYVANSVDLGSVDVLLKEEGFANITRDFIENNFVIPQTWLKETNSIVLGSVGSKPTKAVQHFGFDATQSPDSFDPPGDIPGNVISTQLFGKQYELLFGEGSLSNPVTVFKNPTGTCGNNQCESNLGETSSNCCNDCGCSVQGFVCNKNPKDPNKPGICTDTSTLQLVDRGVKKTSFKSCEVDHTVELTLEVVNAPAGTRVNDFFYQLGNKTRTDIRCNQDTGTNKLFYDCEFTIEAFSDCTQDIGGPRILKDNAVFATVSLTDNSIKELNTSLSDFVITQQTESFNDITAFTERRMNEIGTKLESGVKKAEKLVDTCVDFIEMSINFAYVMVGLSILSAAFGMYKEFKAGSGTTGNPKTGVPVGTSSGSNQAGGQTFVIGNIAGQGQSALFSAAKIFLDSVGTVVSAGLSICEVATTLLNIYVKISEALTTFTTFQVCVKTYQNMLGRGACSGSDPSNPQSAISASLQCVSKIQECSGQLNQMSGQLEGLNQFSQNARDKFKTKNPQGTQTVKFYLEEQGAGQVANTCNDRNVLVGVGPHECTGDRKISLQKTGYSAASDIQVELSNINSLIGDMRNLLTQLKTAPSNTVNSIQQSIISTASGIRDSSSKMQATIQASGGFANLLTEVGSIGTEAQKIESATSPLLPKEATIRNNLRNIEASAKKIENEVQTAGQSSDITSSVYGSWASFTPASAIFNQGTGRYMFTFECPGLGTKTLTIDYEQADCAKVDKQRGSRPGVGTSGPSKLGVQILNFENSRGTKINKQLDGRFYTNTNTVIAQLNNKDIEALRDGRPDRIIGKCWLDWKAKGLGLSTLRRGTVITVGSVVGAVTGSTVRPGVELKGGDITQDRWQFDLDSAANLGKDDVNVIYECEDVSNTEFGSAKETIILDAGLSDSQITGIVPNIPNSTIPTTQPAPAVTGSSSPHARVANGISATLSWSDSRINRCEINWGEGSPSAISTGQTLTHSYGSAGTYNIRYTCYDSSGGQLAAGSIGSHTITIGGGGGGTTTVGNSPDITINSPVAGNVQGIVPISFSATDADSDLSRVEVHVVEPSSPTSSSGTIVFSRQDAASGNSYSNTFNWDSTAVGDKEYVISINARDLRNSVRKDVRVTVNNGFKYANQAPTVQVVSPASGQRSLAVNQNFDVVASGTDDRIGTDITVEIDLTGSGFRTRQITKVQNTGRFDVTFPANSYPSAGTYLIAVRAIDSSGKQATANIQVAVS